MRINVEVSRKERSKEADHLVYVLICEETKLFVIWYNMESLQFHWIICYSSTHSFLPKPHLYSERNDILCRAVEKEWSHIHQYQEEFWSMTVCIDVLIRCRWFINVRKKVCVPKYWVDRCRFEKSSICLFVHHFVHIDPERIFFVLAVVSSYRFLQ